MAHGNEKNIYINLTTFTKPRQPRGWLGCACSSHIVQIKKTSKSRLQNSVTTFLGGFSKTFPLQRCCLSFRMATFSITDQTYPTIFLLRRSNAVKFFKHETAISRFPTKVWTLKENKIMLLIMCLTLDFDVGSSDFLLKSTFVTVKCLKIIRKN